jgi:3,4-dihydroxy-2-butanone 4-phosphate synthase
MKVIKMGGICCMHEETTHAYKLVVRKLRGKDRDMHRRKYTIKINWVDGN